VPPVKETDLPYLFRCGSDFARFQVLRYAIISSLGVISMIDKTHEVIGS
jgi:hypothetical protein